MTTITAPNLEQSITLIASGFEAPARWVIQYDLEKRTLINPRRISLERKRIAIINSPATFDEEGLPLETAGTDLTEFMASFSGLDSLIEKSIEKVAEHEGIEPYVDNTQELEEQEAQNPDIPEWQPNEEVLVGWQRTYNGNIYQVVQRHTTSAQWIPSIAIALWSFVGVVTDPEEPPTGFPAWQPQTYTIGVQVTHNGKSWQNRRPINNQQAAPGTNASGWMEITATGLPQGTWYNLGNEGYPIGYIALGPPCYINNNANNTFAPTAFGWTNITCP